MTALPAAGAISDADVEDPEQKTNFEALRSAIAELPGGGAESTLTIASGVITPAANAARIFSIDTEASAATDDLTNIDLDEVPDGALFLLRAANAGRVPTVKHAAGGDGQFSLLSSRDCVLDSTSKWLLCKRQSLLILEIARFNFRRTQLDVLTKTGNYTLLAADTGQLIANTGASGTIVLTLPSGQAGLVYEAVTDAAQRIKFQAPASVVISDGATDSAAAGFIQCAAALGQTIRLVCVTANQWRVLSKSGTWTIDS